jgi:hypothetical protein
MSSSRTASRPDPSRSVSCDPRGRWEDDVRSGVPAVVLGEPPDDRGGEKSSLLIAERRLLDLRTEHRRHPVEQTRPQFMVRIPVPRHRGFVVEHTDEDAVSGEHDSPLVTAPVVHQRRLVLTPPPDITVERPATADDALQNGQSLASLTQDGGSQAIARRSRTRSPPKSMPTLPHPGRHRSWLPLMPRCARYTA